MGVSLCKSTELQWRCIFASCWQWAGARLPLELIPRSWLEAWPTLVMVSLTVGTSAIITHTPGEPIVNEHTINVPTYGVYGGIYGKREAEPFLAYGGLPYAGHLGYGLPAVVPATHEVTYKTITPTVETNVVATNLPVPVAVGGYKAV